MEKRISVDGVAPSAEVDPFLPLSKRPCTGQKPGVTAELPAPKSRWRIWRPGLWLVVISVAGCGYLGWREYDYRAAVREAEDESLTYYRSNPFDAIRKDWRASFRFATWADRQRMLIIRDEYRTLTDEERENARDALNDLACFRDLIDRLRPTSLRTTRFEHMDGIKGLSSLRSLDLGSCIALKNVDGLKGLSRLQTLDLGLCEALQNLDGLKEHTHLRTLNLTQCTSLQDADGLKRLTGLRKLILYNCFTLKNVDGLKGLTGLQVLDLSNCAEIPATSLQELRAALPNTDITFPDGRKTPPE